MAELMNEGLPAILVPLPTAAENHQMFNARALAEAGAARVIPQDELSPARLADEIASMTADARALEAMSVRAAERAHPHATRDIAGDVATLLPPMRRAA